MSRRPDRSQLECAFGGGETEREREKRERSRKGYDEAQIGEEAPTD